MRWLIWVFCIFLLSGCSSSKEPPSSRTLRVNFPADPVSLDPRKTSETLSSYVMLMCSDGLTRTNLEGTLSLSLASSYELSEDGCEYVFKLKKAAWSNGRILTAYDFERSWKSALDPAFPCPLAYAFYPIKNAKLAKEGLLPLEDVGVKALDAETLQVHLNHPTPYFLELVAQPMYYPYPEDVAAHNLAFLEKKENSFLSLGPFCLISYQPQYKLICKKNPTYWDHTAVTLEEIAISFISDQNTELSMYEQGEIDWVGSPFSSLAVEAMQTLKEREDFTSYKIPGLYYYAFNTEKAPFNNINIRKALTLAINRQSIIEHVMQMDMEPATRLIPTILNALPNLYFHDADLKDAKALFQQGCQEMGLTADTFPTFTISYNGSLGLHYKVAQAIQEQWRVALGIETKLQTMEWKVYLDALNHHDFEVARLGVVSLYADPEFFLEMFAYKNGMTYTVWYDQDFEKLFLESQETLDKEKRLKLIQKAETLFLDEMPIIPLFFYTNSYLKKDYVKNVALYNNQIDFKWCSLDSL